MRCAPVVGRTPQTTTVQNNSLLGLARRTAQVAIPVRGKGCCSSRTRAMRSMAPQAQGSGNGSIPDKTSVLFVCLGNICRSPTAEAMFRSVVERAGLADSFDIDSCGTGGGSSNWYLSGGSSFHEGDEADPRMKATAAKRGVKLTSRSRPLTPADLTRFDYVIGMDPKNLRAIMLATEHWVKTDASLPAPADVAAKSSLMTAYCRTDSSKRYDCVPDPYYGGESGFELVLDLLQDASEGLLEHIQEQQRQAPLSAPQSAGAAGQQQQ